MRRKKPWSELKEKAVASYHKGRAALITEMGGRCSRCPSTDNLEFHHKFKRTYKSNTKSRWQRLALHRQEWKRGAICLLCKKCNRAVGEPTEYEPDFVPF